MLVSVEITEDIGPRHIAKLGFALDAADRYHIEYKYFSEGSREAYRTAKANYDQALPYITGVIGNMLVEGEEQIKPFYLRRGITEQIVTILNEKRPAFDEVSRFCSARGRFILWLMEKGECGYCDVWIPNSATMSQADHIIPYAAGGKTERWNMVCACSRCNRAKGAMDPLVFMERIAEPDGLDWRDEEAKLQGEYFRMRREEQRFYGW